MINTEWVNPSGPPISFRYIAEIGRAKSLLKRVAEKGRAWDCHGESHPWPVAKTRMASFVYPVTLKKLRMLNRGTYRQAVVVDLTHG